MSSRYLIGLTLVLLVTSAVGCSGKSGASDRKGSQAYDLYDRVGEQKLRAVVNDTVDMAAEDPKVALDRDAAERRGLQARPVPVRRRRHRRPAGVQGQGHGDRAQGDEHHE